MTDTPADEDTLLVIGPADSANVLDGKTEVPAEAVIPVPGAPGEFYVVTADTYTRITAAAPVPSQPDAPVPQLRAGGHQVGLGLELEP